MDNNVTSNIDNWELQLIEYSMGTMDSMQAAGFQQGLEECRAHVRLAREYTQISALIGSAVSPAEPPQGHKNRLIARVTSTPQSFATTAATISPIPYDSPEEPESEAPGSNVIDLSERRQQRTSTPSYLPWVMTLAAALILLVGLWGWTQHLENERSSTALNIPPGYRAIQVKGQGAQPNASAIAFINPDTGNVLLFTSGLQPLSPDKAYEAWLLPSQQGANPLAAGIFDVDASGYARHTLTAPTKMSDYIGVAVTVENKPGSNAPTTDPVLVGTY